jgi:hypothetical protein
MRAYPANSSRWVGEGDMAVMMACSDGPRNGEMTLVGGGRRRAWT